MSDNDKMNLPDLPSEDNLEEVEKTKREQIRAQRDVDNKKIEAMEEAIDLLDSMVGAYKAQKEYEATREKWEGRVSEAEAEVEKAKMSLKKAREENNTEREKIEVIKNANRSIINHMNKALEDMEGKSMEEKKEIRSQVIEMAERLNNIE